MVYACDINRKIPTREDYVTREWQTCPITNVKKRRKKKKKKEREREKKNKKKHTFRIHLGA